MTIKEEKQLRLFIENIARKVVRDTINEGMFSQFETSSHKSSGDKSREKEEKKNLKDSERSSEHHSRENRRAKVISFLKDPHTNCAEYMRELWHPSADEEDTKRGYFYKCRDGELDDNGNPYSFNEDEITTLYSLINKR